MVKGNPNTGEKLNCIKEVLMKKGISQKWLADQLDYSTTSVASFCNNITQPHLKDLKRIAELLEVNTRDLVSGISKNELTLFLQFLSDNYQLVEGFYFPKGVEAKNTVINGNHVTFGEILSAFENHFKKHST